VSEVCLPRRHCSAGIDRPPCGRGGWYGGLVGRVGRSCLCLAIVVSAAMAACSSPPSASDRTSPLPLTTTSPTTTVAVDAAERRPTPRERCLERAMADPSDTVEYLLQFAVGTGHTLVQGYCSDDGSHESQLAHDFAMPIGTEVLAARGGTVIEVKEDEVDGAATRFLNYILIRHQDNSVAFYAHLTFEGSTVAVGDVVAAGDRIGLSGQTGRTGDPVLHFGVYVTYPPREGWDLRVAFRNLEGPLDASGLLREGAFYRAVAFP